MKVNPLGLLSYIQKREDKCYVNIAENNNNQILINQEQAILDTYELLRKALANGELNA